MSSLTPAVDDYVEGSVRKNRDIPDIPSQRLSQVLNSHILTCNPPENAVGPNG